MVVAVVAALLVGTVIGAGSAGLAHEEQATAAAQPTKTVAKPAPPPKTETVTESAAPITETETETVIESDLAESAPVEPAPDESAGENEAGGLTMGMYQVGVDAPPGRYVTDGPTPDDPMGCYWERTSDDSGEFDSLITNGMPMGKASVTVEEGEFFSVEGSCVWFQE
ncbi:hypothetical protein FHS23_003428 [Prauserella isguenensis]|uniref:Uncharacterized protein n=1 Tax=Prauserella isguenensis TaxID=1470180 RepID=A0A839S4W7_9PSEU|nr:hypothetical protein [Prauserella isguenensis]MBB3052394.1 hypothetical protein [Prauserella isguenensis]